MIKWRGSIRFWLFMAALSSIVSGCTGSSDNEGSPVIVTVTDQLGFRVPNVTVALGHSNGVMQTYGTTDEVGQITFPNAPENATITAATTCLRSGSTTTTYAMNVQYDVNGSTVLSLDNCTEPSFFPVSLPTGSVPPPLGTVTVNVLNMPPAVTQRQISVGWQIFMGFGSLATSQTFTLREPDLDRDGTFSIIVRGWDADRKCIAYGLLLDQVLTDGMTVDIPMQPMSFVQYQISNIPATALSLHPAIDISRAGKQGYWSDYSSLLVSAVSSTTVAVPYIPGFGGEVSYQIDIALDQDHDSVADSSQGFYLRPSGGMPSDQSFDLSKALTAPSVSIVGADTSTPTLSWSGVDPAATFIYFSARMRSSTKTWYFDFDNLRRSRTSIGYPELPDSLAAFRPDQVEYFSVQTSAYEGGVSKYSSGSYQTFNPQQLLSGKAQ